MTAWWAGIRLPPWAARGRGDRVDIQTLIIALLPSLCVSLIMAYFTRQQHRRDERDREREQRRIEAENVQVSLLVATAKLSYALAMAAKRGTPNGEVEEGIRQYQEAMRDFKRFERHLVAKSGVEE